MDFAQVGQTEKTSSFVLLSSAVRAGRMLSADEQIINFLFYIRQTFEQKVINCPAIANAWPLYAIHEDHTHTIICNLFQ
jgi:hypothetical protein